MFPFQNHAASEDSQAHFEAQIGLFNILTNKVFDNVGKLATLNLNTAKTTLAESGDITKGLLCAKGPQDILALSAAQVRPTAEKATEYGRHLVSIASATHIDFSKVFEAQMNEFAHRINHFINEFSKNAPAGSEPMVSVMKATIDNVNAGVNQLTKTTQQAVDTLETTLSKASTQFPSQHPHHASQNADRDRAAVVKNK